MFDIEIGEVYSLNQEVPNTGRHRKRSDKFIAPEDITLLHDPVLIWN
jgi:hypothetical protein